MRIEKTASGSSKITISKDEWTKIGVEAGWNGPTSLDVEIELNGVKARKSVPIPLGMTDDSKMLSYVKGLFTDKGYEVGNVTLL